jgi:hypothetical protein
MTDRRKRLESLLIDEATDNLTDATRAELDVLLREHPEVDRHAFERVAAAVFLSIGAAGQDEKMPASLKSRLTLDAEQLLGGAQDWPGL